MNPIIELKDIRAYYHVRKGFFKTIEVKAVDGVSFSIKKGEIMALVGESGCGKTTLGKVTLRLLRPMSGRIIFDGKEITYLPEADLKWFRRRAQPIFQDPYSSINPFMTVKEILEEPLILHGIDDRDDLIHRALEEVRLTPVEEFLKKYPHMLSGGQRQRVCIARALILRPDYIVADEPVSMIDASSRAEILYLLRDLRRKYRVSFLYITHDIATARHFSDKVSVMYLGKIIESADPRSLIEDPLHPYTQALIEAIPEPDPENRFRRRKVVSGEPPSPINPPPGCRFHPRCPYAFEKCRVEEPKPTKLEPGHMVACHLREGE